MTTLYVITYVRTYMNQVACHGQITVLSSGSGRNAACLKREGIPTDTVEALVWDDELKMHVHDMSQNLFNLDVIAKILADIEAFKYYIVWLSPSCASMGNFAVWNGGSRTLQSPEGEKRELSGGP